MADAETKPEGNVEEAVNHLVQGKRHMLVQDYVSAVSSLEEACSGLAKHYGETANECGEAYLCYGKALLELARMENGVLGNALQGAVDSEEESEESKESEEEQVENPDNVTEDDNEDESESTGEKSQDETNMEEGETSLSKEEKEDVSNLQLAWEVLELAKVIFLRQAEKDEKLELKLMEVLLKLGEVSIESENYVQAIEDLNSCLTVQKKHLTPDDRSVAETYYQLGLAYSFDNQYECAVEHFTKSIQVLEERIANCRQVLETSKKEDASADTAKKEIEELEALLPEIKSKIEDTEDMMKNAKEALIEAAMQRLQEGSKSEMPGAASSTQGSPSKATTNVSHLVKRKRTDDNPNEGSELKKVKSIDSPHDESKLNGSAVNGSPKPKDGETVMDVIENDTKPKVEVEVAVS